MDVTERRPGRPSRIYETFREGRCGACGDWIREPVFRSHVEREHPQTSRERIEEGFSVREILLRDRLVDLVEAGNYLEDACGAVGIRPSVVYGWIRIGAEWEGETESIEPAEIPPERRVFSEFSAAIARAREAATTRLLRPIERAASTDWRAAAWILERTRADRFGKLDRLKVGGDAESGPVRVIHEEADPNFVEEVTRIYRDAGVVPDVDSGTSTNGQNPKED